MANNKKQVRDFIAVRELQYGTEQEFIQDVDKVIAECETDESMTNQLRFYKQVRLDVERTLLRFPPSKSKLEKTKSFSMFLKFVT